MRKILRALLLAAAFAEPVACDELPSSVILPRTRPVK